MGLPPPGFKGHPRQGCTPETLWAGPPRTLTCGAPERRGGAPAWARCIPQARVGQQPKGIVAEFRFYIITLVRGCEQFRTNGC